MQVGQVTSLITSKVQAMTRAGDWEKLCSKHKAITALLPYAVLQERDGQPEMLDTFLHAARASKISGFRWCRISQFADMLLSKARPHAIVLISCHIPWFKLRDRGDCVQLWAAATCKVPSTGDFVWSVVHVLLLIASEPDLLPYIPAGVWSWMLKQPSLPPFCFGYAAGTKAETVEKVQGLKDIEVLKSHFHVVWSEWNLSMIYGGLIRLKNMDAVLHKEFSGIGMGHHRADLIQRLDHILGELDQGLDHLQQHKPNFDADDIQRMKNKYGELKNILLEMNVKAITRMSDPMVLLLCTLIHMDVYRILCNIYVCTSSPMSIVCYLFLPPPLHLYTDFCTHACSLHVPLCLS